jgi:arylsulfatase A-like enzyme
MIKKWAEALKYGIILGTMSGLISGIRTILLHNYLDYHLYNTSFKIVAKSVDGNVGLILVTCGALALLWQLGVSMKRWPKAAYRVMVVLAVVGFLSWTSGIAAVLADPYARADYLSALTQSMLRLVMAVVCLLLGVYVLRRVRQRQPSNGNRKADSILDFPRSRNHVAVIMLIIVLSLNLTAAIFSINAAATVRNKPNIIFVMFDTCRADQLGCYGYSVDTSPNIDKFAKGAMRFDRPVSQATITTCSVGSFMTSRYPQNIILQNANDIPGVPENLPTLAGVLRDKGYSTSAVISNMLAQEKLGFAQGFDYFNEEMMRRVVTSPGVLSVGLKRLAQVKDKPFFMFLLFVDPHTPYVKHDEYNFYPDYKGKLGERVNITDDSADVAAKTFSSDDIKYLRALYNGEIKFTDRHFGMLMEELKKRGLYDNTMIVFLGDHGEEFMEHGRLLHGHAVYEETTRVPLIVKLPGQTSGSVVGGVFPLIDLFPSILKYIGADPSLIRPQGRAVDFNGLTQSPEDRVFTAEDAKFGKLWAVQDNKYKLIWNTTTDDTKLFDMQQDRGEKTNIAKNEPDVLRSLLDAAREKEGQVGWNSGNGGKMGLSPRVFSDEDRHRLRSLGYAQ